MHAGSFELCPSDPRQVQSGNLFAGIPTVLPVEVFECLWETPGFRLERILSKSHATPQGEWYDQVCAEWVILLQGAALLRLESENQAIRLNPGDYIYLPAHARHRVEWTDPVTTTVWLAIHNKSETAER